MWGKTWGREEGDAGEVDGEKRREIIYLAISSKQINQRFFLMWLRSDEWKKIT